MTSRLCFAGAIGTAAIAVHSAHAAVVRYDFTGITYVGGESRTFTGIFEYDTSPSADTVYFNGTGPVQQGFRSSYYNSIRRLSIELDDDESVTCGPGGYMDVNNIQQAEPGSQVPEGLSAQAWAGNSTGTINGLSIRYMYLAFLPIQPAFSWDPLDDYFHGNSEALLQNNPSLLPRNIDPSLTGTTLEPSIQLLAAGVFLGTIHDTAQGTTTTVNTITSFELHIPAPSASAALCLTGGMLARRRRHPRVTT